MLKSPFCGSFYVIKYGKLKNAQIYFCKFCLCQFLDNKRLKNSTLIREYVFGKQTIREPANKYKVSEKTIRRKLFQVNNPRIVPCRQSVVVCIDTTYWRRTFGLLVMQYYLTIKILWYDFVKHEKLEDYKRGIQWIENNGFTILAIVCDGLKGLAYSFPSYPIQLCMFHQKAVIKRYLTNNPKLAPAIELNAIMSIFTDTDKESFTGLFDEWYDKWKDFINERRIDTETGEKYYVHKMLRSACLSLKRNMPYIWIWYDYPELNMSKTNNILEVFFSHLKRNLNLHNGLSKEYKKAVINEHVRSKNFIDKDDVENAIGVKNKIF